MAVSTTQLDRFLRALYRRLVVLRLLECAGLGMAIGSAGAVVLLPILLWRGQPALPFAVAVLGLGAAAGLAWGLLRRPGVMSAAMEADRQLRLADLLGTAWLIRDGGGGGGQTTAATDPWSRTVLAMAEARCREVSPSAVVLHRLGARAWGGVGLASALVLTLGALSTRPQIVRAERPAEAARLPIPTLPPMPPAPPETADDSHGSPRRPGSPGPQEAVEPDPGEAERVRTETGDGPESPARTANAAGSGAAGEENAGDGAGRGEDAVPRPGAETDPGGASLPTESSRTTDPAAADAAATAGGSGRRNPGAADQAAARAGATTSADADPQRDRSSATPWHGPDWAGDVRRAHEAIDAGRVPDAYRDLIRGYFEPR